MLFQFIGAMTQIAVSAAQLTWMAGSGIAWLLSGSDDDEPLKVHVATSKSRQGLDLVTWLSLDGERGKSFWDTPYEDVFVRWHAATVDADTGDFVVLRQTIGAKRIWRHEEPSGEPEETEDLDFEEDVEVVCERPYRDLLRFSVVSGSGVELKSDDLAYFRAGRLRYTEHHLIRIEFADGRTGYISRCQGSHGYNAHVAVTLANVFIANRPAASPARQVEVLATPAGEPRRPPRPDQEPDVI